MTFYNWLCLLGVPTIVGAFMAWTGKTFKKQKADSEANKLGTQALLRDRLYSLFDSCEERGYASFYNRENFENMYKQYHSLGANGVMDDIRQKFMNLPVKENKA